MDMRDKRIVTDKFTECERFTKEKPERVISWKRSMSLLLKRWQRKDKVKIDQKLL